MRIWLLVLLVLGVFICGCSEDPKEQLVTYDTTIVMDTTVIETTIIDTCIHTTPDLTFLYLAHTRGDVNPTIIDELHTLNYDAYDYRLYGGDMTVITAQTEETVAQLNAVFGFDKATTLWSLGNHDYTNHSFITDVTGRPTFYSHSIEKLTFVVFDDQETPSNFSAQQVSMLTTIVDTVTPETTLLLLTHQLMWMRDHPVYHDSADVIPNGGLGDIFWQINPNNFHTHIYPQLQRARAKDVTVLLVSGDLGAKRKYFEYTDDAGVVFLASGMQYGHSDNSVILFSYNEGTGCISWKERALADLEYTVSPSPTSSPSPTISADGCLAPRQSVNKQTGSNSAGKLCVHASKE